MKKIKITITYHSAIDIITNSSSEIFCMVKSDTHFKEIEKLLLDILGPELLLEYNEDTNERSICFSAEWGSNALAEDFLHLLEYILIEKIGIGNFKIENT